MAEKQKVITLSEAEYETIAEESKKKVSRAMSGLILNHPFFATIALQLQLVENPFVPTAYTDGEHLGYNPLYVKDMPLDKLMGLLIHEVSHVVFLHMLRLRTRQKEIWNLATDVVINLLIKGYGFKLPDGGLYDERYANMDAEEVYAKMMKEYEKTGQIKVGNANIKVVKVPSMSGMGGQGDPMDGDGEEMDGEGQGGSEQKDGKGKGGKQVVDPKSNPNPWNVGGVEPVQMGKDEHQIEEQTKTMVQQAAQIAKRAGKLPANMERELKEIIDPPLPWREVLQRFVTEAVRNDYTWKSPNRRYMSQGIYMPSLNVPELKDVLLFVDTSGSIDEEALAEFANEIKGIADVYRTAMTVVYCDAEVYAKNVQRFEPDDPIKLKPKGGGGTRYSPCWKWLEKENMDVSVIIYLTDGYCNDFPKKSEFPTLWVLSRKNEDFHAPFGETIVMKIKNGR